MEVTEMEKKVANKVVSERTALAVATIAPLSLAGTNKW